MAEGFDVNIRLKAADDSEGPLRLHEAAARGDVNECERLLVNGLRQDVNQTDPLGWTPLMVATRAGHCRVITSVLLPNGADVSVVNAHGVTVLSLAVDRCACSLLREVYRRLSTDQRQSEANNALHAACLWGRHDVVSWLLSETSALINFVSPVTGWTALMVAVVARHLSVVELLLERGADTTVTSCLGEDVFDLAAATNCPNILRLLQDHCVASLSNPEFAFDLIDCPNTQPEDIEDDLVFSNSPSCPVFKTCNDDYESVGTPRGKLSGLSPSRKGVFQLSPTSLSPRWVGASLYSEYNIQSLVSPRRVPSPTKNPNRGQKRKLSNKISCSSWLKGLTKRRARSLEDTDENIKIAKEVGIDFPQLLFSLGIEEFAPIFKEQELDIWTFLTLTEEDLEIMGIHEEMSKKRILRGIQMLRKSQL